MLTISAVTAAAVVGKRAFVTFRRLGLGRGSVSVGSVRVWVVEGFQLLLYAGIVRVVAYPTRFRQAALRQKRQSISAPRRIENWKEAMHLRPSSNLPLSPL